MLVILRAALVSLSIGLLVAAAMARGARARTASILGLVAFALAAPALALRRSCSRSRSSPPCSSSWADGNATRRRSGWHLSWSLPGPTSTDHSFSPRSCWATPGWTTLFAAGRRVLPSPCSWPARPPRSSTRSGGVWAYAAGIGANSDIAGQVSEWQRTTPFIVPGLLFYLSAAAAFVLAFRGRAGLRWPDWLFFAAMFAIGVWAVRGLAWWPFGAVFVVGRPDRSAAARVRDTSRPPRSPRLRRGGGRCSWASWWSRCRGGARPIRSPAAPVSSPTPHPGSRRPSRPSPARKPRAGRPDVGLVPGVGRSRCPVLPGLPFAVPAEVWTDRTTIAAGGPAADDALTRWEVDLLVLPAGTQLGLTGWSVVYEDADGVILGRGTVGRTSNARR